MYLIIVGSISQQRPRYFSEIIIPIYKSYEPYNELIQILNECSFDSFRAERASRSSPAIFIGGEIFYDEKKALRVDQYGRCCIDNKDKFLYTYL